MYSKYAAPTQDVMLPCVWFMVAVSGESESPHIQWPSKHVISYPRSHSVDFWSFSLMCEWAREIVSLQVPSQSIIYGTGNSPQCLSKDIISPAFHCLEAEVFRGTHRQHKLRCLKLLSFFFLHISFFSYSDVMPLLKQWTFCNLRPASYS